MVYSSVWILASYSSVSKKLKNEQFQKSHFSSAQIPWSWFLSLFAIIFQGKLLWIASQTNNSLGAKNHIFPSENSKAAKATIHLAGFESSSITTFHSRRERRCSVLESCTSVHCEDAQTAALIARVCASKLRIAAKRTPNMFFHWCWFSSENLLWANGAGKAGRQNWWVEWSRWRLQEARGAAQL